MIKTGSDFSGVGAFDQALDRLGIKQDKLFACDMDKYARQTYCLNYGTEQDLKLAKQSILIQKACLDLFSFNFPIDVYEREIPKVSLDIYMTSPPCQAFSLAGKRLGKEDQRGILFFNSLEFIQENKPRYFIFENVKGLLSHDKQDKNAEYGRTFQEWINYLGGKSVNGVHTFFPIEDSVPYHIYFQVLNAKHYGIPQNRERIFIIGIRDDADNNFQFPKPFPLTKRLKDVLEIEVDEKYFLSEKLINFFKENTKNNKEKGNGFAFKPKTKDDITNSITTKAGSRMDDNFIDTQIGTWRTHEDGKGFRATEDNNCPTIPARAREDGSGQPVIKVNNPYNEKLKEIEEYTCNCGTIFIGNTDQFVKIGAIRGRNPENPKSRQSGLETEQMLEINENGTSNALTTVQKDNVVIISTNNSKGFDEAEEEEDSINFSVPSSTTRRGRVGKKVSQTLDTQCNQGIFTQQRIRRLLPIECMRLMDFNEDFIERTINSNSISDSQLYKQCGNSICVGVLVEIIKKLNL